MNLTFFSIFLFFFPLFQVTSICSLKDEKDGTCLGQLTLPSSWWPSVTPNLRKEAVASLDASSNVEAKIKQPKVLVEVKYSVYETRGNSCDEVRGKKKVTATF